MSKTTSKKAHPVVRAARHVGRHAKDHFIPHEGNNHVPHVLKHRVLLGYSIALVLLKAVVISVSLILPSYSVLSGAITQPNIVSLTNEARANQGLAALKTNAKLAAAAQAKAQDMLAKQYFAHTSPSGTTPWSWIRQAGYSYSVSGENLAIHYTTAEGAFAGWLASPSHRANIVNPKFTEIGVGVAEGVFQGHPSVIVVQMFGRPQAALADTAKTVPTAPKPASSTDKPAASATTADGAVAGSSQTTEQQAKITNRPAAAAEPPIIDRDSVSIKPEGPGYAVELALVNASSAVAQLGNESIELEPTDDGTRWHALLKFDPRSAASGGETLSVTAWNAAGLNAGDTLALIAPSAKTQELFAFASPAAEPGYRLFGILPLDGLRDSARQIYLLTLVALAACLLIAILVKFHVQKPTIIVHTLVVMGLSALLMRL